MPEASKVRAITLSIAFLQYAEKLSLVMGKGI